MQIHNVKKNIKWSIVQIMTSLITALLVYRVLILNIGLEEFGKWALLISFVSISKIFDLGLSNSSTRFMAKYLNNLKAQQEIFSTTQIAISLLYLFSIPMLYLIIFFAFPVVYSVDDLALVYELLPLMIVTGYLFITSNVFLGSIDGFNKIYLRSYCVIASTVVQLFFTLILVPKLGILGFVYAQLFQSISLFVLSRYIIFSLQPSLEIIPNSFRYSRIKEIFSYSLNVQISALAFLIMEPVTKFLITLFGGMTTTGIYETANQLVLRLRSFLTAANQTIVPIVAAGMNNINKKKSYLFSFDYVLLLSGILFLSIVGLSNIFSLIFFQEINVMFIFVINIISLAYFINSICLPSFFINVGDGNVHLNTHAMVLQSLILLFFGIIFGYIYGGLYVIYAYCISLSCSGFFLISRFFKVNNYHFSLLNSEKILIFTIFALVICFNIIFLNYELLIFILNPLVTIIFIYYILFKKKLIDYLLKSERFR